MRKSTQIKFHSFAFDRKINREILLNGSSEFIGEMSSAISLFAFNMSLIHIYLRERTLSKGEFRSVAAVNGGLEGLIKKECKDRDALALVTYIAEEDKLDKILPFLVK